MERLVITMPICKICNTKITGIGSAGKSICANCLPVEPPRPVPPVYCDTEGNLLYVDAILIKNRTRYAIFYRNAETNFDADLTRLELTDDSQFDRFTVILAMRKMVDRAVSAKCAMWKRVA